MLTRTVYQNSSQITYYRVLFDYELTLRLLFRLVHGRHRPIVCFALANINFRLIEKFRATEIESSSYSCEL